MQTCVKCFRTEDEAEFRRRYDGKLLKACNDCIVSVYAERKKKSYAIEVAKMREKGRQLRRLNETQVAEIVAAKAGGATNHQLALEYGVSHSTISKVVTRGYK